jgi:hypothetical protein
MVVVKESVIGAFKILSVILSLKVNIVLHGRILEKREM